MLARARSVKEIQRYLKEPLGLAAVPVSAPVPVSVRTRVSLLIGLNSYVPAWREQVVQVVLKPWRRCDAGRSADPS